MPKPSSKAHVHASKVSNKWRYGDGVPLRARSRWPPRCFSNQWSI